MEKLQVDGGAGAALLLLVDVDQLSEESGRVGATPDGWWRWSSYGIKIKEAAMILKDSGGGGAARRGR